MFVRNENMFDDIGTKLAIYLNKVKQDFVWINGFDWMMQDKTSFPAKMTDDIRFNHKKLSVLRKENLLKCSSEMTEGLTGNQIDKSYILNDVCKSNDVDNDQRKTPNEVLAWNKFSKYLVRPNRKFKKMVTIFAFVLNLINKF